MSVRICERSEQLALVAAAEALAGRVQPGAALVDLGPHAGADTALLTAAMPRVRTVQLAAPPGVDLAARQGRLARLLPEADVMVAVTGRTGWPAQLPPHARRQRIVHLGAGTFGWMPPAPRRAFLARLRRELRGSDIALICCLVRRDAAVLETAFDACGADIAQALGAGGPVTSHFDPATGSMVVLGPGPRRRDLAQVLLVDPDPQADPALALPAPLQHDRVVRGPDGAAAYLLVTSAA